MEFSTDLEKYDTVYDTGSGGGPLVKKDERLGESHSTQTCSLERSGHRRTKNMPKTHHQWREIPAASAESLPCLHRLQEGL